MSGSLAARAKAYVCAGVFAGFSMHAAAQVAEQATEQVIDVPTRAGVTQRMLLLSPAQPKAAVILFAGGNGGLRISADGVINGLKGNFLVRTRRQFAQQGLLVALVDAPSDRQGGPFLDGFRQTGEHVADIRAAIARLRQVAPVPVWLIGTSRGTQSVAYIATGLSGGDGPDGIVLSSTILTDKHGRAVPLMPLGRIRVPVLVVHHENDGCALCSFSQVPWLMDKLTDSPRKRLLAVSGGQSRGDPCEAFAHHGYNGIEDDVVQQIAGWILAR
jgi:hypothetical protein